MKREHFVNYLIKKLLQASQHMEKKQISRRGCRKYKHLKKQKSAHRIIFTIGNYFHEHYRSGVLIP